MQAKGPETVRTQNLHTAGEPPGSRQRLSLGNLPLIVSHFCIKELGVQKRWLGKSAQSDKWNFRLNAAKIAADQELT